jgi:hypothetical protein
MINWKKFGENLKGATGVSLAGLFLILATNGKEAIEVLLSVPLVIKAFSTDLPFGLWSGVAGTVMAGSFHLFARSWTKRSLGIEIATIITGLTVVMVQQNGGTAGEVLSAAMVGLAAGFGGLFGSKLLRQLFLKEDNDGNVRSTETLSGPD